jgi:glycosyltransferase involved in cell wall biosynthesis
VRYEDRVSIVFPYQSSEAEGGPSGFISQLLRDCGIPRLAVTPHAAASTSPLGDIVGSARQFVAAKGRLRHARRLAREKHTFREIGGDTATALWFMESGTFSRFERFISPLQTVIYQPHCPQLPWEEIEGTDSRAIRARETAEVATRALFARADWIVLPNEGARCIYDAVLRDNQRIYYLLSGAAPPKLSGQRLPLDPTLTYFLYIGRRVSIKGFDVILAAFRNAREQRPEIRLVLCGRGELIDEPGVIDVGPTTRVHDWIAACDCVVNGNRQSYFDLSVMETLAVGTPLAMTATGGHSWFLGKEHEGLRMLPNTDGEEGFRKLFETFTKDAAELSGVRERNRELFDATLSRSAYHRRLHEFVETVVGAHEGGTDFGTDGAMSNNSRTTPRTSGNTRTSTK